MNRHSSSSIRTKEWKNVVYTMTERNLEINLFWFWRTLLWALWQAKNADCLWISHGALWLPSSLKHIGSRLLPGLEELALILEKVQWSGLCNQINPLFVHISHKVSIRCNDRGPWVTKFSQMRYQGLPIHFQCCKQVQNTSLYWSGKMSDPGALNRKWLTHSSWGAFISQLHWVGSAWLMNSVFGCACLASQKMH